MKKLTFAAIALLTATTTVAEETAPLSAVSVQGDFGYAHHRAGSEDDNETGQAFAPGIALTYHIDPQWAVRLQHVNAGEFTAIDEPLSVYVQYNMRLDIDAKIESKASWTGLMAQYQSEQHPQSWSVGARFGATFWKHELVYSQVVRRVSHAALNSMIGQRDADTGSDNGVNILGGVFAQYHFSEQLAFTADLDLAPFSSNAAAGLKGSETLDHTKMDYHVSRVAVGVQYRF